MLALLDCEIVSGIDTLLNLVDFDKRIKNADYVFTGEGRLDSQSFNGKLISGVLSRTKKQNIKTICMCGQNSITEIPNDTFYKVFETSDKNASQQDIGPTILGLAGFKTPINMMGRSLFENTPERSVFELKNNYVIVQSKGQKQIISKNAKEPNQKALITLLTSVVR